MQGCISKTRGVDEFLCVQGGNCYALIEPGGDCRKVKGREHTEMLNGLLEYYHSMVQKAANFKYLNLSNGIMFLLILSVLNSFMKTCQ
jgi:hypothetical protein